MHEISHGKHGINIHSDNYKHKCQMCPNLYTSLCVHSIFVSDIHLKLGAKVAVKFSQILKILVLMLENHQGTSSKIAQNYMFLLCETKLLSNFLRVQFSPIRFGFL